MSPEQRGFLGRITIGMSGQAFARIVQAGYTILLVPVLIRAWGIDGYGQWIALTALTSYMGLSNFGLVTTSANDMVIASGAGDSARAKLTFQISINLTIFLVLPLIILLVTGLSLAPLSRGLHLSQIDSAAAARIIACSGAALWFQTLRGLMVAALYATGSYGFAYYVQGAMKFCELLGIGFVVSVFAGSQVSAAILVALMALVELFVIAVYARRAAPWARVDFRAFDRAWISSQAKPAIGFMVSNLATQGLMTQGPRVVLGALLGGPAVALYSVYATAMRFVDQLLLTLVMPLEVEIAHSSGRGDFKQIHRLIVLGTHFAWAMFLCIAAGLLVLGPIVFRVWTAGRIEFSYGLMALFMCLSAANLQGRVSLHALISTNRLYGPSFLMLGFAAVSIVLGALLTPLLGVNGMVVGGIAGEIVNSTIVIIAVAYWLQESARSLIGSLFDFRGSYGILREKSLGLRQRRQMIR